MDIDFSFWLVIFVGVSGAITLLDVVFFLPRRQRAVESYRTAVNDQTDEKVLADLMREPLLIEYSRAFFPVLAIVLVLRSFLVEPYKIPSGSMLPTLEIGDYILVNKFAYGLRLPVIGTEVVPIGKPKRGDVLVFRYPEQPSINYIKRVVGLPGDEVRYEDKKLYINGVMAAQDLEAQFPPVNPSRRIYNEDLGGASHTIQVDLKRNRVPAQSFKVPADSYLVFGDNRDNSRDSRYWGYVPDGLIVGKAFAVWMHMPPGSWVPSFARNGVIN